MTRQLAMDGSEIPEYYITVQPGKGLENVPGLAGSNVYFGIDPVGKNAAFDGTVPSSALLRQAILGVFLNAQSILKAAKFTVSNPAPPGKTLWSSTEIISLAGQAQPWILAATDANIPIGQPFTCPLTFNGYGACNGADQLNAFTNMLLTWGGEYLGLRTRQSFDVLVRNLLTWARANAPSIDPAYAASSGHTLLPPLSKPILMLWPTLRADPALSTSDRETIENWISTLERRLARMGAGSRTTWAILRNRSIWLMQSAAPTTPASLKNRAILWRPPADACRRQLPSGSPAQRLLVCVLERGSPAPCFYSGNGRYTGL